MGFTLEMIEQYKQPPPQIVFFFIDLKILEVMDIPIKCVD
jgi:hypothetical protein